jgi:hypothetical protein
MGEAPDEHRADKRLAHLRLQASVHVIKLARLASVFDTLITSGQTLEETKAPASALSGVPDVDLDQVEDDMTLGQAADILRDFFGMSVEGEARLHVLLGLED